MKKDRRALALLTEREQHLREQVAARRASVEQIRPPSEPPGDVVDLAFARSRAEVEHELIDSNLREIGGIEQARARINEGTYGICADCALEIDSARLEVNPAALRCADCQDHREQERAGARRGLRVR